MTAHSDRRLVTYAAAALLVLALVALHTHHFAGRNYRQDEAWLVHMALENTLVENVRAGAIADHPVSWYIFSDVWVTLAGDRESMTRFFSTLVTALALALLFPVGVRSVRHAHSPAGGVPAGHVGVFPVSCP
jgi:hypothetical protein